MWNMDGNVIDITLQKTNTMHWWKAVLEGEPEINVQKVQILCFIPQGSYMQRLVSLMCPCVKAVPLFMIGCWSLPERCCRNWWHQVLQPLCHMSSGWICDAA